jgi:hypothetical protein
VRRAVARKERRLERNWAEYKKMSAEEKRAKDFKIRLKEFRAKTPQFKLLSKRLNSYCQRHGIKGEFKKLILQLAFRESEEVFTSRFKNGDIRDAMKPGIKRYDAVKALAKLKDKRAALPILWSLPLNTGFKGFIEVLGELRDKSVFSALERMLKEPERKVDEHNRREIMGALIKIDPQAAVKPALRAFRKDKDEDVKEIAAKFLGEMKVKTAAPLMVHLIRNLGGELKYDAAVGASMIALGKIAPTICKGEAKKKIEVAAKILGGGEEVITGVILYALAVNPELRRHAPSKPGDRLGVDYLRNLNRNLTDSFGERSLGEIFSLLGLSKKKKKRKV